MTDLAARVREAREALLPDAWYAEDDLADYDRRIPREDARYIALLSPDNVEKLLDEREKLLAVRRAARNLVAAEASGTLSARELYELREALAAAALDEDES